MIKKWYLTCDCGENAEVDGNLSKRKANNHFVKHGWRKRAGVWYCPYCIAQLQESKIAPYLTIRGTGSES